MALAARHALPAIFPFREYALAGGLMGYGSDLGYLHHEWGIYSGRILKGEKPEPICRSSRPLSAPAKARDIEVDTILTCDTQGQAERVGTLLHGDAQI